MLEKLAVHHVLWIKMLVNLGCKVEDAQDLVQDMYIRLHTLVKDPDRIMYGDDINRHYVWVTLRNMYFSSIKKKRKITFYELRDSDDLESSEYDNSEDNAFEIIKSQIDNITSSWTVYDKRLFELYFIQGLSLRAISKGSKIGLTSIHTSVLNYKRILRESLSEDLMDYFNQDFNKIQ
jgi:RNA polymerase sigma factor (sigma-70 family)|tara:strand:- start:988 stop:1521 length:534 start_codon:yes stop_codon:yes gene_type:complete